MPHRDDDDDLPAEPDQTGQQADPAEEDERVGYGRPPKRSRFVPGQSGNPAGRPKGSLNRATLQAMVEGLWIDGTIKITEGGRERQVPRLLGLMMKQADIALKGDRKAIKDCFDLVIRMTPDVREAHRDEETTAEDDAILRTHRPGELHVDEPDTDAARDEGGDRE